MITATKFLSCLVNTSQDTMLTETLFLLLDEKTIARQDSKEKVSTEAATEGAIVVIAAATVAARTTPTVLLVTMVVTEVTTVETTELAAREATAARTREIKANVISILFEVLNQTK